MYPLKRNRRLRNTQSIRSLVQENHLSLDDIIVPLFVVEGAKIKEEIPSMPDYYRMSLDFLVDEVTELWKLGLKSVLPLCQGARTFKRQQRNGSAESKRFDAISHKDR